MRRVFLVPGFFGFKTLGSLNYFQRVGEILAEALGVRGVEAEVLEIGTQPTSSIRRRALRLLHGIQDAGEEADELHFVGHSTGGLDVRLLLTPGVKLERSFHEEALAERTRSVITISTPHFGTPLAGYATSLGGRNLLWLLTLMATSRPGRLGVYAAAQALTHFARIDDLLGQRHTVLDTFVEQLLADVTPSRRDALHAFMNDIAGDQGSILQLTPESIDIFNAAVVDRPGVAYVSFATGVPRPPPLALGRDLYAAATRVVFSLSWMLASREHRHYPYPSTAEETGPAVAEALGFPVDARTNDGIVPTRSQLWGRFAGGVRADHLDVVGQFPHEEADGRRYPGWLSSGSGFDERAFRAFWGRVADVIAESSSRRQPARAAP